MNSTTAVKDPVCGMDINAGTAAGQTEHAGKTYYFCGAKCKQDFDVNPEEYISASGRPTTAGGCCG